MQAKYELNQKTVRKYIDLHKKLKIPFEMTLTNYTTRLQSRMYNLHFLKNAQNNRTFAAYQKVKSEVIKKPVPVVPPSSVNYFSTNIFEKDFYADVIYNIDLKAAYATVLRNEGYITTKTLGYLLRLPKQERLTCVGMLAGKKNIFKINEEGQITEDETIISPTADYFFYCVQKTSDLMNEAKMILFENFLFTWVDGIYFLDKEQKKYSELISFFNKNNFKVSFEVLKEFYVQNKESFYAVSFIKEGKKKFMNVPKQECSIRKAIANYLITKNY